jgi:hypothetical protein
VGRERGRRLAREDRDARGQAEPRSDRDR